MVSSRLPGLRSEGLQESSNVVGGADSSSLLEHATLERQQPSSPAANPNISNLAADDEERYEAFGVIDDADSPQGSGSPAASPIAGANPNRNPRSPNSMLLGRHTWLRTSLGRSPAGANRKRLSSNALASQLYRSSSFNSSGRGSICDTADDVYSDVSLEDDVIDLNHRA
ncbi:hypothetical protein TSAR_011247 [Trichomalopsis sarcophagae]|uniref:Uncharacterized protein n=1 Tax=Trichomalopsis sarcophagae TaxID=543379 RepID=A0A232F4D9_9HYME|nr:hypothetical protein TSAR_011247 [Trichomalopsis sarcophagae]